MARRRKNNKSIVPLLIVIIISVLMLSGKGDLSLPDGSSNVNMSESESVYVHFIDVGQGSATLIQQGKTGVLIDAGEREYGETVVNYIKKVGVEELALAVASHPHSDHIGGLDEVLYAFPVERVILPELTERNTPTTRVYEDLLIAIDENGIEAEFVLAENYGEWITDDLAITTIGPESQSDNLNDMSVMCLVGCFDTQFFILGDAEEEELREVYNGDYSLEADVIAMGHHGSSTSIYEPFLDAVGAEVAVISCGKDNSYGHPHDEALEYIEENNMTCYRTDEMGDIVFKVTKDGYRVIK